MRNSQLEPKPSTFYNRPGVLDRQMYHAKELQCRDAVQSNHFRHPTRNIRLRAAHLHEYYGLHLWLVTSKNYHLFPEC